MCSDFIAALVFETHPLIHVFGQQPVTQRLGVLAEVLRIGHHAGQHALLHLFTFNLCKKPNRFPSAHLFQELCVYSCSRTNLLPSVSKGILGSDELIQSHP